MKFHAIVIMSKNGAIGYKNKFLSHDKKLLAEYKKTFHDKNIVIGKNTFLNHELFKKEKNLFVLSKTLTDKKVKLFPNFIDLLKNFKKLSIDEIYILGGESIFEIFYPLISHLDLFILNDYFEGDAFFKAYRNNEWNINSSTIHNEYTHLSCTRN